MYIISVSSSATNFIKLAVAALECCRLTSMKFKPVFFCVGVDCFDNPRINNQCFAYICPRLPVS